MSRKRFIFLSQLIAQTPSEFVRAFSFIRLFQEEGARNDYYIAQNLLHNIGRVYYFLSCALISSL